MCNFFHEQNFAKISSGDQKVKSLQTISKATHVHALFYIQNLNKN